MRAHATSFRVQGAPHRLLGTDNAEGARFRFIAGTVLAYGIPQATRASFEDEVLGEQDHLDALDIASRYPGIANAYAQEQWARVFEPLLGAGTHFGAVWGTASRQRHHGSGRPAWVSVSHFDTHLLPPVGRSSEIICWINGSVIPKRSCR